MLLDRRANDLGQKRFRDLTSLRMSCGGGCERAITPANKMPAFAFLQTGRSSQFLQNIESYFDPLFSVFAF